METVQEADREEGEEEGGGEKEKEGKMGVVMDESREDSENQLEDAASEEEGVETRKKVDSELIINNVDYDDHDYHDDHDDDHDDHDDHEGGLGVDQQQRSSCPSAQGKHRHWGDGHAKVLSSTRQKTQIKTLAEV